MAKTPSPEDLLAKGTQALKAGQASAAEDLLFRAWQTGGLGGEELGSLYFAKAWYAEAATFLEKARPISPQNSLLLAESYLNLGLLDEALGILGSLDGKILPGVNFLLGRAHLKAGNFDRATGALEANLKQHPDDAPALVELGIAHEAAGRDQDANSIFTRVKISHPGYIETLIEEANRLFGLKLFGLSKDCLKRAERVARKDARIFYQIGIHYTDLNLAEEAEAAFKNAIRWRPSMENYRGLAIVYERSNQLDKAMVFCRAPLSANPDDPYLNTVIAKCELRKGNAERALSHLVPYKDAFDEPAVKAEILNILGLIYDKLGRADDAYRAFIGSNQAIKKTPEYSNLDLEYPYRNIETYGRMLERGIPALPREKPAPGRPVGHVFFMGFPRSGTTLVQTILESHKSISTIDEKPVLRAVVQHLEKFEKGYPEALAGLSGEAADTLRELYFLQAKNFVCFDEKTTLVDKMPMGTLHLPLILTLFPEAKIIFAVRHPYASSLSCLMQNFNLNNAMGNLTGLDEITRFYSLVMGFWKKIKETRTFDFHYIKYESLTEDLEKEARALTKFLELEWDQAMMDFAGTARAKGIISTPSYHQVVQPVYTESVEKWRAYEKYFEPYKDRLDPFCELFGYSG